MSLSERLLQLASDSEEVCSHQDAADLREASRAVRAWEICENRRWKAVPIDYCGLPTQWRAHNQDGRPEHGADHPDPITAILSADAALGGAS